MIHLDESELDEILLQKAEQLASVIEKARREAVASLVVGTGDMTIGELRAYSNALLDIQEALIEAAEKRKQEEGS